MNICECVGERASTKSTRLAQYTVMFIYVCVCARSEILNLNLNRKNCN